MKKVLSLVMALALILGLAVPAFATNFVPSIENKGAPEFVFLGEDAEPSHGNSKNILGYVVDGNGNAIDTAYEDCIVIYSLKDILDLETDIPEDIRAGVRDIYADFIAGDHKPSEFSEELNAEVAKIFGEGKNADMLVIRDIFDIAVSCDNLKQQLEPEGTTIALTLDVDIPADGYVAMLAYKNNEWVMVEKIVNNNENDIKEDDGTITVTFENFCPFVLLVPGAEDTVVPPAETAAFPWWILVVIAACGGAGYYASKKKKEEK